MKRLIAGLVGLTMLYLPIEADCASRKQLGIPEAREECLISQGINQYGEYVKQYDMDKDGKPDMEEAYLYVLVGARLVKIEMPYGVWADFNKNVKVEESEVFYSPKRDENWIPRKDVPPEDFPCSKDEKLCYNGFGFRC